MKKIIFILFSILCIFIALWIYSGELGCGGDYYKCIKNQKEIIEAIGEFYKDNHFYPNTLEELFPKYIKDWKTFKCPNDSENLKGISYGYIKCKPQDPSWYIVLFCGRHQGFRSIGKKIIRKYHIVVFTLKSGEAKIAIY